MITNIPYTTICFLKEAVGCAAHTQTTHSVFVRLWFSKLSSWPCQVDFDPCCGTKAKLFIPERNKKCLFLQPVTSRMAHVICSVVLGRKCISAGCQRHATTQFKFQVLTTFLQVTGFDSFSHNQYFIRKYMSSG